MSLFAWLHGMDQGEACKALSQDFGMRVESPAKPAAPPIAPRYPRPILPVPEGVPALTARKGEEGRWEYRDAAGRLLLLRVRTPDPEKGKTVITWTWCETGPGMAEWRPKAPEKPWPLYGWDRLARNPEARVLVVEGEKTADAAERIFPGIVAVTSGSSESAASARWEALAGREVIIWRDADEAGQGYENRVSELLLGIAKTVRQVALPDALTAWVKPGKDKPGGWDLADPVPDSVDLQAILDNGRKVETHEVDKDATSQPDNPIKRLAALHPLEYEKVREAEAERLGCRVSVLDEQVKAIRPKKPTEGRSSRSPTLCPQTEMWPETVVPARLLDEIKATIKTFIVCDEEVAVAGALWASFTWFIDVVQVAPIAVITAPEPRCGKTQFLDLLGRLVRRPLVASNISPAAVFRVIEAHRPTLMIDEADSFLKENEELRGVINSGHTRQSAYVIRTVGDDHEPQRFSTWGAKALSGIGRLAGTLMDRAVVLELRRKLKSERVQRLRHADPARFERLASQLATFADASSSAIQQARPTLPDELNDRAQDNWEPLLAIADHAGEQWPKIARDAALKLAGIEQDTVSQSGQLLADIRDAFSRNNPANVSNPKLSTADLIRDLSSDDLKPWNTFDHGRPITPSQLARMLKPYLIKPKDQKLPGGTTLKGYALDQFQDTFARYLDAPGGIIGPLPATSEQHQGPGCSPSENRAATTRYPQPDTASGVASESVTRDQGATSEPTSVLEGSGVAGEVGGVANRIDTFDLPPGGGGSITVDL